MPYGQVSRSGANKRWREKHPEYRRGEHNREKEKARIALIDAAINPCYLKEARAMLEGKNTRGKNKCVKLAGD